MRIISGYSSYAATAGQMRALDKQATEVYGIPSILLMENAGRIVAEVAEEMLKSSCEKKFIVVCGPGNNGGDGFVAARYLYNIGREIRIFYFGDRKASKGDALINIEIAEKMGLDININDLDGLEREIGNAIIIDALLGTGVKGAIRTPYNDVIEIMNSSSAIISVDIPSGIDADTGTVCGNAVSADITVTMAAPKVGLLTGPGLDYVGDLVIADIGIPLKSLRKSSAFTAEVITWESAIDFYASRPCDSNKGNFGHLTIIAGSVGMTGAATLAAQGALRIGTGLVTLLVPESLNDIMEVKVTEAMTIPVSESKMRAFGMASLDKVLEYANKWDAAVIGPGFGRDEDTIEFTLELIRKLEKPAIIDADALYAVSKDLSVLKECKAPLVITPHPGEMATLLGTTAAEVQSNRLETARSFAQEYGVCVVLKGAGTVIAEPDGQAFINTTGTPGMATGGTGDVLSGMIGGVLAQEPESPYRDIDAAVYLHGKAGELAAEDLGEVAMTAGDLVDYLAVALKNVNS